MNIKEFVGVNSLDEKQNGEKMTHEEKFQTIVNAIGLDTCVQYLPATKEQLKIALEKDEHLNNIPLKNWDEKHPFFKIEFKRIGINSISLSDTVCTLKQAAKMYVKRENE